MMGTAIISATISSHCILLASFLLRGKGRSFGTRPKRLLLSLYYFPYFNYQPTTSTKNPASAVIPISNP
jgi:hypothetical protein